MQRSVPEVAEATEVMEWLERKPLGYEAEPVFFHKCGIEGYAGKWYGMQEHFRTRWVQRDSNSGIENEVLHPNGFSFLKK